MLNFASLKSLFPLNQYHALVILILAHILLLGGLPHASMVKLNCDPAFKLSKSAIGIAVRDSICSLRYVHGDLSCVVSPFHAEVIAVHSACSLASSHEWLNVIVELDSQMAISFSTSEAYLPWRFATFIDNIHL